MSRDFPCNYDEAMHYLCEARAQNAELVAERDSLDAKLRAECLARLNLVTKLARIEAQTAELVAVAALIMGDME
jgi:hypothetical protein